MQNCHPNTQQILSNLNAELTVLKGIRDFHCRWINNSISKSDILLQYVYVPQHPLFIRTIEQRANDLLADNDSRHSLLNKNLNLNIYN